MAASRQESLFAIPGFKSLKWGWGPGIQIFLRHFSLLRIFTSKEDRQKSPLHRQIPLYKR
jgi:hypothetical protein